MATVGIVPSVDAGNAIYVPGVPAPRGMVAGAVRPRGVSGLGCGGGCGQHGYGSYEISGIDSNTLIMLAIGLGLMLVFFPHLLNGSSHNR